MAGLPTRRAGAGATGWLKRRLDKMERDIALLATSRATVGNAGVDGRRGLTIYDLTGKLLGKFGRLDGTSVGFATYRANGLEMLRSRTDSGFGNTSIFDRNSAQIVTDDPFTGGLARPRISLGQWVDNTPIGTAAAPTTSATFVTLQTLFAYEQQPCVRFDVLVSSSASGTTGEVQVLDPFGSLIGSVLTVPANANTRLSLGPVLLPSWPSYDTAGYFSLQARRTAGTGSVGVRGFGAWGAGSFDVT